MLQSGIILNKNISYYASFELFTIIKSAENPNFTLSSTVVKPEIRNVDLLTFNPFNVNYYFTIIVYLLPDVSPCTALGILRGYWFLFIFPVNAVSRYLYVYVYAQHR